MVLFTSVKDDDFSEWFICRNFLLINTQPQGQDLHATGTCWSHSGHDLVATFTFLARLADMLLSGGLLFSFSFNSLIYQKLMWAKTEGKGLIIYFSHIIIITCSSVIYWVSFLFPLTTDTKFFIYIKVCGWHCEVPLRTPSRNEELMPPAVGNSLSLGDCLS